MRVDPNWGERAACRSTTPDLFFPPDLSSRRWSPEPGKAICARCPVMVSCLRTALRTPSLQGVWGHATEYERGQMHKWIAVLDQMSDEAVRVYVIAHTRYSHNRPHGNRLYHPPIAKDGS